MKLMKEYEEIHREYEREVGPEEGRISKLVFLGKTRLK